MTMIEQLEVYQKYDARETDASGNQICGDAGHVGRHGAPVNGRCQAPSDWTSGWIVWCGENLATDAEFLDPSCMSRLTDRVPAPRPFPGLAPGCVAVGFDATLLTRDYRTEMFGRFSQ